ncbi:hypothetical protein SMD11_5602 [Streptomyces albireticuli]|uniref:Uncharacterized protein n=1 Tax=Streptomyces albireticuli TaxID=1940 RepID=A0A1Z2LAC0_9ACTN|nr:hypothetical protein SMD11_5602 [Streptomyces albireticuli]
MCKKCSSGLLAGAALLPDRRAKPSTDVRGQPADTTPGGSLPGSPRRASDHLFRDLFNCALASLSSFSFRLI